LLIAVASAPLDGSEYGADLIVIGALIELADAAADDIATDSGVAPAPVPLATGTSGSAAQLTAGAARRAQESSGAPARVMRRVNLRDRKPPRSG
jgi:hypothetical protein